MNFIPPANYGMVERNTVYRSGFPQDKHLDFMGSLKIRSILYVAIAKHPSTTVD